MSDAFRPAPVDRVLGGVCPSCAADVSYDPAHATSVCLACDTRFVTTLALRPPAPRLSRPLPWKRIGLGVLVPTAAAALFVAPAVTFAIATFVVWCWSVWRTPDPVKPAEPEEEIEEHTTPPNCRKCAEDAALAERDRW